MCFEFNKENLKNLAENFEKNKILKIEKLTQEYVIKLKNILAKAMIEYAEN